jgi:hypothetical protein
VTDAGAGPDRTLDGVLIAALEALGLATPGPPPVAIGWATVDLDRAAGALSVLLPPGATFRPGQRSDLLGAACRVADDVPPGWPVVVLLEPDTEGRLAATLARRGETWAASWSRATALDAAAPDVAGPPPRDGPLGPERLRHGDPVHGPHHLVL